MTAHLLTWGTNFTVFEGSHTVPARHSGRGTRIWGKIKAYDVVFLTAREGNMRRSITVYRRN